MAHDMESKNLPTHHPNQNCHNGAPFLPTKRLFRKSQNNKGRMGLPCSDKPMLAPFNLALW